MRNVKKASTILVLAIALVLSAALPLNAGPRLKSLGTDPALDGPPAADIVGLSVGREGRDLLVRIHLTNGIPVQGSLSGRRDRMELRRARKDIRS